MYLCILSSAHVLTTETESQAAAVTLTAKSGVKCGRTRGARVQQLRAGALELGRVEEAEYPRHGELRHGEEERAEERDGHHQVEVD